MSVSAGSHAAIRSTAFVGLGSNQQDPLRQVQRALREIDQIPDVAVVGASSIYETAPVGFADQPDFVNAVGCLETSLSPHDLMRHLTAIERRHGRVRAERNGPRTLDLDLLLFGDRQIDDPSLTVPHPRMHERAFVLVPLHEIAPATIIPGHGSVAELLGRIDTVGVRRLARADGIAA